MEKIPVVVVGPFGKKLGKPVCDAVLASEDLKLLAKIVRPETPKGLREDVLLLQESFSTIHRGLTVETLGLSPSEEQVAHAVVFFAVKAGALDERLYEASANGYRRLVIGTTGLSTVQQDKVYHLSENNTIVYAPNFSEGAWIGAEQCLELAVRFPDYHAEIIEAHHWEKADAPSGTANMWARAIAMARGLDPNMVVKCGRNGMLGKRNPEEIWISAVRGGSVTGYHKATFYGPHDEISIEHNVRSSALFAQGALRAIRWAAGEDREPGFYGMPHILGLSKLIELGLT